MDFIIGFIVIFIALSFVSFVFESHLDYYKNLENQKNQNQDKLKK